MKVKLQIKNRWTGSVIFELETENNSMRKTVDAYIKQELETKWRADLTRANLTGANLTGANLTRADLTRANLTGANLTGANLTGANLTRANLTRANLTDADLTGADLTDADLTDADLTGANLTRANLTGANLTDADLTDANLTRANLTDADLTRANLTDADLTDANLTVFKHDVWAVLLKAKHEIAGLKQAIKDGKIDGSTYSGDCRCLKGTIAACKGPEYNEDNLPGLVADSSEPCERWFMQLSPGDTPENNGVAKLTLEWIEEFEMYLNT
jgi:uncharacterized protein YjbI with pentapeptide repeats